MAYNLELWTKDFAANLYDKTDFYTIGKNHSEYVNGNIVHIPNAASPVAGGVLTNGTVLPVASTRVTYSDLTYAPATLYAGPMHITNIDLNETSFDSRTEAMSDIVADMKERMNKYIAIAWAPLVTTTVSIVDTSGTATRGNIFGNTAIKKITLADLTAARVRLEAGAKRGDDLYLIVDPFQFADLVELAGAALVPVPASEALVKAHVAEYAGFKIIKRYNGIGYTALKAAKVAFGAATAITHLSAALAVSGSMLSYAVSNAEMGVDPYAMGYFGAQMQASARVGASPIYPVVANEQVGVVAIIESK